MQLFVLCPCVYEFEFCFSYKLIESDQALKFTHRNIFVKGKGLMSTYLLESVEGTTYPAYEEKSEDECCGDSYFEGLDDEGCSVSEAHKHHSHSRSLSLRGSPLNEMSEDDVAALEAGYSSELPPSFIESMSIGGSGKRCKESIVTAGDDDGAGESCIVIGSVGGVLRITNVFRYSGTSRKSLFGNSASTTRSDILESTSSFGPSAAFAAAQRYVRSRALIDKGRQSNRQFKHKSLKISPSLKSFAGFENENETDMYSGEEEPNDWLGHESYLGNRCMRRSASCCDRLNSMKRPKQNSTNRVDSLTYEEETGSGGINHEKKSSFPATSDRESKHSFEVPYRP